jgi:hypothetical protein
VDEQVEFTRRLIGIFNRNFVNVIAYSMPLDEFVKVFPECKDDPVKTCYSELLKFLMLEIVDQIKGAKKKYGRSKPVNVVLFHDRCDYDVDLLRSFNKMMDDPTFAGKEIFSTPAPLSWQQCLPLQAADLIAYENFKDSERQVTGRPRRKSFDFILEMESFGGRAKTFHAEGIRVFRQAVDNIRRDSPQPQPGSLY